MMEVCPKCGEKIVEDSNFCDNCGKKLDENTCNTTVKESFIEKNKIPLSIIGITAIIVLIVVVISSLSATEAIFPLEGNETQRVEVNGLYFNIPAEYVFNPTTADIRADDGIYSVSKEWIYSTESINIMSLESFISLDDYTSVLSSYGGAPTTMYGYDGYLSEDFASYVFIFEKNDRIYAIMVSSPYLFDKISVE